MWQSWLTLLMATVVAGTQVQVNPVEKVIELLKDIRDQVQKEGKEEAVGYDKFACFCKDQADEKLFMIKKSEKKISTMTAEIKVLEADIKELDDAVAEDKKKKASLEQEGEEAAKKRAKAFDEYSGNEKDMSAAIKAIAGAIEALEQSKDGMQDADLDLLASKSALHKAVNSGKPGVATTAIREVLAFMEQEPAAYNYASNDIISTLQGLLKTFKKDKVELDTEEAGNRQSYEMEKQARDFKITKLGEMIEQNTAMSAQKTQSKSELEASLEEETSMKKKDSAFLEDLTNLCEEKAKSWDERSKSRAAEITAITEALGDLESGVAGNYAANKKLNLVAKKAVVEQDSDDVEDEDDEVSFLQRRDTHSAKKREALKFLSKQAKALKSPVLSTLVMKIKEDHFKKVRDLIKDMVARLESEAEAEASQKGWCDEEMAGATEKRDDNQAKIESENASIIEASARIEKLSEEIRTLGAEVADLYKALNEQTQLREEDHTDNVQTLADAKAGLTALQGALTVLQNFYNDPSGEGFVQTSYEPFKAAGSGADGKTVADLAPGTFEGAYEGKQNESKGILGLLNVIESDFERTISTTEQTEADNESTFQQFKADTESDIGLKNEEKANKEGERESTEADLVDFKDELKEAKTLKGEALDELEKLKPACVSTGSSYKEKVARRKQEIEALKEATKILTDMR